MASEPYIAGYIAGYNLAKLDAEKIAQDARGEPTDMRTVAWRISQLQHPTIGTDTPVEYEEST